MFTLLFDTMKQLMTPAEIVSELDRFIIGQTQAKKSVAIALRNRWRRHKVDASLRHEITPKNILMIGPTGVGKTEIARRLAKLAQAPFIKVEATKFTEVGYVGKDVESIIRDLVELAIKELRVNAAQQKKEQALVQAEEKILDILLPLAPTPATSTANSSNATSNSTSNTSSNSISAAYDVTKIIEEPKENATRQMLRKKLRTGELDHKDIEIEIQQPLKIDILGGQTNNPQMDEAFEQLKGMFGPTSRAKKKTMPIKQALVLLSDEIAQSLINEDEIRQKALENVEQNGIVFLDEIDKIAVRQNAHGGDVSRQGVQRDLLPLVEGTTVNTKYGMVSTQHILFIASGAFHLSKPSDLIPELQGRFPIRVELDSLTQKDFCAILTQTDACLIKQYQALFATEDVNIIFDDSGIQKIAEIACQVNEKLENIGARRLYTVLEKVLEDISYHAPSKHGQKLTIDADYVVAQLGEIAKNEDLSRYIL